MKSFVPLVILLSLTNCAPEATDCEQRIVAELHKASITGVQAACYECHASACNCRAYIPSYMPVAYVCTSLQVYQESELQAVKGKP